MDLEGVKRWLPGDRDGYAALAEAMAAGAPRRDPAASGRRGTGARRRAGGPARRRARGIAPGAGSRSSAPSRGTALELHGWARRAGHATVGERLPDGGPYAVVVERGPNARVLADPVGPRGAPPPLRAGGELHTADLRRGGAAPPRAPTRSRVRARWAPSPSSARRRSTGAQRPRRALGRRRRELAEQATRAQWDASRDVPWEAARELPDFMERAVAQVMTFIAQNEYAALYVPAAFLPHVNPAYAEVVMWLAGHVHDEARHIEVFTKRALIGGYAGQALASTELSLKTLLEERDFSGAALLLNVLGEGTFLDLLRVRRAPRPRRGDARRRAPRPPRRGPPRALRHLPRPAADGNRSRHAREPRRRSRAAGREADRDVRLEPAARRGSDDHGSRLAAACRVGGGRSRGARSHADDGGQPNQAPAGRGLRRGDGDPPLGAPHPEPHVRNRASARRRHELCHEG